MAKVDALMARCDSLEAMHKEQEEKRSAARVAVLHGLGTPAAEAEQAHSFQYNWQFLQQHFSHLLATKQDVAELRKTILQLAVMGKLVPQNPTDEPASLLLKKIAAEKAALEKEGKIKKQKPLPPVREEEKPYALRIGWEWVRLGEVGHSIEYGTSIKSNDNSSMVPVFRMGNITDGKLTENNMKYISPDSKDLPRLFLRHQDLLFNRTNSFELVGKTACYYGKDMRATFASYLIRISIHSYVMADYVNRVMNSSFFRTTQIEPEIVQQCGQANFNGTKLSLTCIPLPPLAEQHRIVAKVDALMARCDAVETQLEAQTATQTRLLDAVMAAV